MYFPLSLVFSVLILITLSACSNFAKRVDNKAEHHGFERILLDGTHYQHVSYQNFEETTKRLHVYIEGDGVPWIARYWVSPDPTSPRALMLDLMALDQQKSLYLGRPCYLGQAKTHRCHPILWTHQRYSDKVVDSMEVALKEYLGHQPEREIILFGHSGGGAIAVLLAARLDDVIGVVTVAGNLDIQAWTDYHGYTPLKGSLNPVDAVVPEHIFQIHLVGGKDKVVPPMLVEEQLNSYPNSLVWRFEKNAHSCCWRRNWPLVLTRVEEVIKLQKDKITSSQRK